MNTFDPKTFSTDWEVMIIDRLNRCISTDKCCAFAGVMRAELDLPVHHDWRTIEFGLGVNTSMEQFWQRIVQVTDRASELVRKFDLDLFPAAAHPTARMFNASHLHVGSIHDETAAIRLQMRLVPYLPAFAALAANSPFSHYRRGEAKSYRVRHSAHGDIGPCSVRDPYSSHTVWGRDAVPKMHCKATLEVRVVDCASSRRLLAEMGTFAAAFVHHLGSRAGAARVNRSQYHEALTNRWAAARHGMQATFLWAGGSRPVAEVLNEMLDACGAELAALGAKRRDLALIRQMIRKRVCQADFAIEIGRRYPDPHLLTNAYSKMVRHWEAFDEHLRQAAALEPAPAPDKQAIFDEHLRRIGEGTLRARLHDAMYYPAPLTDALIDEMIRRGLVRKELIPDRGTLLHRLP